MENRHQAIDKFVIENAKEYGFVSDYGCMRIFKVYESRCVFAHPYEKSPSQEEIRLAASVVVEHVLSKPVKLGEEYGKNQLENLLKDPNYLDDYQPAVLVLADIIFKKLDENLHDWLLDEYWKELEKISDEPTLAIYFRRGVWFTHAMLIKMGAGTFSHEDWHRKSNEFPKTLVKICSFDNIFKNIGKLAQDYLVGSILDESATRPSTLTNLEPLSIKQMLNNRQQSRFIDHISTMKSIDIRASGLRTKTCFDKLIILMKINNWDVQNPAIDLVVSNGPKQAEELDEVQQVILGQNLLQSGDGNVRSAVEFIENLSKNGTSWPFNVVRGIALESFINEHYEIRFKSLHLERVLSALTHLEKEQQNQIMEELSIFINTGTLNDSVNWHDSKKIINKLKNYDWTTPLVKSLETKTSTLPKTE